MKKSINAFILILVLIAPTFVSAQTTQQNAAAVRSRYNPNVQVQSSGSTFQGLQFSGVGSAIAGCANVGGLLSSGINSVGSALGKLFKTSGGSGGGGGDTSSGAGLLSKVTSTQQSVPVTDKNALKEQKKQTQTIQCLNGVAYAVAHNVLQQVTNKTLAWVNTGFNGNPLYIRDIDSYLHSIRDEKINSFLQKIPNQDPVFGNALRSILTQNVTGKTDGLINKTMNTPQGRAYEAFQKDFTQGGWQMLLDPTYNPISAAFNAGDQLGNEIDTAQQNVQNELQRNGGFLDMKKCVEWAKVDPDDSADFYSNADGSPKCLKYETVTPGSVISAQVNEVTTSPIRQLEQADQINEVLGSFFDQLLNRLFANGLSSLSKKGRGVSAGIGSNVVIGTNGQILGGSQYTDAQNALGYQTSDGGFTQDFDISRPQQLRAIIKTQMDYINKARDARIAMSRVVPILGALDYCFPGPNPTWTDGLDENYLSFYNGLETPDKTRSAFHNFLTSLPLIGSLFGGGSNTIDNALIGQPILTDKVTTNSVQLNDPLEFVSTRRHAVHADFKVYFDAAYQQTVDAYKTTFSPDAVRQAFMNLGTTPAEQNYARGFVTDTLKETKNLVAYDNTIAAYDAEYVDSIDNTADALDELNAINAEVQSIVATAKARYIAEQAAAGTPVIQSCIDSAYIVDTSPIVGTPRLESSTPLPIVEQSDSSRSYFYDSL